MNNRIVAGILAHVDTGKTTLSESLLYKTGVINHCGRVDNKDAFLDTDSMEKERGITIYTKSARLPLDNLELILIDTPGHVDFSTEMERALSVLDVAILLISGSSGIQPHTRTLWNLLKSYRIPTFIFVNKMDMEGADKNKLLLDMKKELSSEIVDFTCPEGETFYENVASLSEYTLNKYLEDGSLSDNDIISLIKSRDLFPTYFGSALKLIGIDEFVDGLNRFLWQTEDLQDAPLGARVYKITRDTDQKRLTFIKLLSGSLKIKDSLGDEKVNEIRIYSGDKYENVQSVNAPQLLAVVGLENPKNGDVFGNLSTTPLPILSPAISYAVHYPDDIDRTSMLAMLRQLEEEDPSLNVEYREQTHEIFVSLMGDIQTEILKRRIEDLFNVAVTFSDGKVCYKETISDIQEGVGHFEPLRHYAEVHIRLEPLERGSGIEFESDISEDILAKNWQRLILTHMLEKEHRGVLTGSPLTDIKMTLVSGKAHIKHTEGGDFRQATYRAIRQGLMELSVRNECHLLEPYYDYTLELPEEYIGRAMTDITRMSGTATISETNPDSHISVLTGRAPVSTMKSYSKDVIAYTKGLGVLSLALSGYYDCHNEEEVLSNTVYNPENDIRNTPDSVFCSHGAGTVVPWYDVPNYMHLPYNLTEDDTDSKQGNLTINEREVLKEASLANKMRQVREQSSGERLISIEEIDSILHQSTHANEKGRQGSYKGISQAVRERRKYESRNINTSNNNSGKEIKYTGTVHKDKYILVDGYNLIHAWPELSDLANTSLAGAAGKLNDILCNYQAIDGASLMVIYDAYKVKGHPTEINDYHNITVVYTKEAQTADQYIEQYTHENSKKYDITVITSDGLEQIIVTGNGSNLISSREFIELVDIRFKAFNEQFKVSEDE